MVLTENKYRRSKKEIIREYAEAYEKISIKVWRCRDRKDSTSNLRHALVIQGILCRTY